MRYNRGMNIVRKIFQGEYTLKIWQVVKVFFMLLLFLYLLSWVWAIYYLITSD